MPNAIDTFRAQREAAEAVHERLQEIAGLLALVLKDVDAVAANTELRSILQREEAWLSQASRTVSEVRAWREREARQFLPSVARRWALALVLGWPRRGSRAPATRTSQSRTQMNFAFCAPVPLLSTRLRTGSSQ